MEMCNDDLCINRSSMPQCFLQPAVIALLIRYAYTSEIITECRIINSSRFTKTLRNTALRYDWTSYVN